MKTLHCIRHAKSSWNDPYLADAERPLNKRGRKSCQLMAEPILKAGCNFSHVFCSVATRAQQTINGIKEALPGKDFNWTLDEALYTFNSNQLLVWCQALNNDFNDVVFVGHNPAITDLCNKLSGASIKNVPTCGYVQLLFSVEHWADLTADSASLVTFLKPKMLL